MLGHAIVLTANVGLWYGYCQGGCWAYRSRRSFEEVIGMLDFVGPVSRADYDWVKTKQKPRFPNTVDL